MKKIIEKTAWTIDDPELPESVKRKILEKHSDINVDYAWWEPTEIYFPSWAKDSKLDEFNLDRSEVIKFLPQIDYRILRAYLVKDKITDQIILSQQSKRNHWPFHFRVVGSPSFFEFKITSENNRRTTRLGICFSEFPSYSDSIIEPTEKEIKALIFEGISYSDDKADKLGKSEVDRIALHISKVANYVEREIDPLSALRESYDYLTSEEGVLETLQANEYYFDEDGDIV